MSSKPVPQTAPLLALRGVTIKAAGREILRVDDVAFHEGERVLVVGPSGAGKSLFVNLLLGFLASPGSGLDVAGRVTLRGRELATQPPEARDGHVGAVFQLGALGLFDDLTVAQNLSFGRQDKAAQDEVMHTLRLEHLPASQRMTACSGGEQMRVALARTLLRGAGVLLYDEPTTGLDPAAKAQVVEAIDAAHRALTVVVTHDYPAFEGRADVVLFLDPRTRKATRLSATPETFHELGAVLHATRTSAAVGDAARRPSLPARLRAGWTRFAVGTIDTLADALSLLLLPLAWARLAHGLHGPRVRAALRRDLSLSVGLFVGISAILVSFTGTYFLFERLPEKAYTEPLVQDDLLAGIGLIATRVGIPLMVSILLAAKLGAAAAAQLGHMSFTRQVDALRLMRVSPTQHLLWPTATGQLFAAWLSVGLSTVLAYGTTMVVFLAMHPGWSARYVHHAYVRELATGDLAWVLTKVGVSALGVSLVAFRTGTSPKRAPGQVVRGIHKTLLRGLLLVLTIHALFAFLEF